MHLVKNLLQRVTIRFRTGPEEPQQHNYLKSFFEQSVIKKPITYWPEEYNTAYQITTKESKTWIHHDDTTWAAVLYLIPNAPPESGTGIYRHKESGIYEWDGIKDSATDFNNSDFLRRRHMDQWEQIAFVGNVYNRLVCYKGSLYHRSVLPGFGTDKYSGRLFANIFLVHRSSMDSYWQWNKENYKWHYDPASKHSDVQYVGKYITEPKTLLTDVVNASKGVKRRR